ncbi:MAG: Beta-hexosaminidase A [Glaciecola sp. HTCC2999]|jgi:beta-N-acetylhexosaminidase|nr:MAG: Beta-hexosaminidase A [Glaciecola sp. HTCC2999]
MYRVKKCISHMIWVLNLMVVSVQANTVTGKLTPSLPELLGQKIMIDIRYFCADDISSLACRKPVTVLPTELAHVIKTHQLGGVILFSENVQSVPQIQQLTTDIQALNAHPTLPMFIAIDQEGGRVARLPTDFSPAYSGNMAIGATYHHHQTAYAAKVGGYIGHDLASVGINVNFAPSVDVNANPRNPVINVRSFSESATVVSELGGAFVEHMQAQGVLAALKHFPGHGDTVVDSHTGLPLVNHDLQTIMAQDIAPFKAIIEQHSPAFVMTAHIQYPQLDNSQLLTKDGTKQVRPATLSPYILTDLLRGELGFEGLVITDALDMAGIAQYFSPKDAVLETFNAGADIALMPYTIRNTADIKAFNRLMDSLKHHFQNKDNVSALLASYARIVNIKSTLSSLPGDLSTAHSHNEITLKQKRQLSRDLARASMTQTSGPVGVLSVYKDSETDSSWLLVMPDALRCAGLTMALKQQLPSLQLTCINTTVTPINDERITPEKLKRYDVIIAGDLSPQVSVIEMGGMDDLAALRKQGHRRNNLATQQALIAHVLRLAPKSSKRVFVALRNPYPVANYHTMTDATFALYDYRVDPIRFNSDSFEAFVNALLNQQPAPGKLPVRVN